MYLDGVGPNSSVDCFGFVTVQMTFNGAPVGHGVFFLDGFLMGITMVKTCKNSFYQFQVIQISWVFFVNNHVVLNLISWNITIYGLLIIERSNTGLLFWHG